jgi:hypothetical protein
MALHGLGFEPRQVDRQVDEPGVQAAVEQGRQLLGGSHAAQAQPHVWKLAGVAADRDGHHSADGHEPDAELSDFTPCGPARHLDRVAGLRQRLAGLLEEAPAACQLDAPGAAEQQRHVQPFPERSDLPAEGRLADLRRHVRPAQLLGQRYE